MGLPKAGTGLCHFHDDVMVIVSPLLHQLRWQGLGEERIKVPKDRVLSFALCSRQTEVWVLCWSSICQNVDKRDRQCLEFQLEVPQAG